MNAPYTDPDTLCDFCSAPKVARCRQCSTQWCATHKGQHAPIHAETMDDYAREGIDPPSVRP